MISPGRLLLIGVAIGAIGSVVRGTGAAAAPDGGSRRISGAGGTPGVVGAVGAVGAAGSIGGTGAAGAAGGPGVGLGAQVLPEPRTAGQGGASGSNPAGSDAATAKRMAALRKKVLKDDDFVENDETNRDPFHSYLRLFVDHSTTKTRKVPAVFDKVGLEELTLIAIVSGDETPRAMFRDATGLGQSVKKGDFLSRAGARVTKILSDRVIVEISEQSGTGDVRVVEKAILVNPDEAP